MKTKKILGLDLGTNSIGAALINMPSSISDFGKVGNIEWVGSRIIPIDGDYLQKFESGAQAETKAAARRIKRGSRRLKHRYKLRRTRLIQVFKTIGWLDENFPLEDHRKFKKKINEEENFKFRINDYLPFEKETIEKATHLFGVKQEKNQDGNISISEDWIIYYLRKKALTEKISLTELCRITYMMNQRRGFKSSSKDLKEENSEEKKWVEILNIDSVTEKKEDGIKRKDGKLTFVIKAGKHEWKVNRSKKPEWEGKEFKLLFTESNGKMSENPKLPGEKDWELSMVALDNQIADQSPGEFFFNKLVEDKNFKIRQIAVRREKYKKELETIWNKQIELRKCENTENEILNAEKIEQIALKLYKHNEAKQKELKEKGLLHIISNDIIYYQRELKSQKNSVGECQYEKHAGIDSENYGIKCVPKSSPEFQEFRIWQDIHNIRILERQAWVNGITKIDLDVTKQFINTIAKEKLFNLFDNSKEISEQDIFDALNQLNPLKKLSSEAYRINLFANRQQLLGNETKQLFRKVFRKHNYESEGEVLLCNHIIFRKLWHIIYSISSSNADKSSKGITSALGWDLNGNKNCNWGIFELSKEVAEGFTKLPEPKKEYASYSSKAINKLLVLMRCGNNWKNIDEVFVNCIKRIDDAKKNLKKGSLKKLEADLNNAMDLKNRIENIVTGQWDFAYDKRTGEFIKEREFTTKNQFAGLPVWMACYVAYNRHSERESDKKFQKSEELNVLKLLPNNSLRNPLVEQVIRETLFVVKDLWETYGQPDEIHIELGRELKKNAKERERESKSNVKNFEEKQRIKKLLSELLNGDFEHYDEEGEIINTSFEIKPHPGSPVDVEKFRIFKSCGAITSDEEKANWDILFKDGKKERIPTNGEIKKYTLWLSQKCMSPYTGKIIPLSKLFDRTRYEVEHVIPKSKIKYDALENLVIAETAINPTPYKGNLLGRTFIQQFSGQELNIGGTIFRILTNQGYEAHCKNTFRGRKLKNLLATEVPEDFVERQINDTRYITRKISELLYPVAKDKSGLVFTIGSITNDLKREWGLNSIWKKIIKPRFERLEKITGQALIIPDEDDENKFHFNVKNNPGLNEKRIDHRHHALDALIIAATTKEHIRYLNSLSAVDSSKELQLIKRALVKSKIRDYKLPWEKFAEDAKNKLHETIVTFKVNSKIVSKPSNNYLKWVLKPDGSWKKEVNKQQSNKKWMAVRKSMFKEPQGIVWLKKKKEISILDAFKIQIERMKVEYDKERRKTASYIYDQTARPIIKDIIEKTGINLYASDNLLYSIKNYLKKNSKSVQSGKLSNDGKPVSKTVYLLGGYEYERVTIAEFFEYAAKRVKVDSTFTQDKISKIPYSFANDGKWNLAKRLSSHLQEYENDTDKKVSEAFTGEGLEEIAKKNKGNKINKVTICEQKSPEDKFGKKYVEVDAGAIAYFIIYENEVTKERDKMYSLPTHKAIERLVLSKRIADKREGYKTIIISPNDLVYVPTGEELQKIKANEAQPIKWDEKEKIADRIYKMNSSTGSKCEFVPHRFVNSNPIIDKIEFGANNINQRAWDGIVKLMPDIKGGLKREDTGTMIKQVCIKLNIDRLGNISLPQTQNYPSSIKSDKQVYEPEVAYKKRITVFNSFDEMENNQLKYFASLDPEELLRNLKVLSLAAFGLKKDPGLENLNRKIIFKKEE